MSATTAAPAAPAVPAQPVVPATPATPATPAATETPQAFDYLAITPEKYRRNTIEESYAEIVKGYTAAESRMGEMTKPLPTDPAEFAKMCGVDVQAEFAHVREKGVLSKESIEKFKAKAPQLPTEWIQANFQMTAQLLAHQTAEEARVRDSHLSQAKQLAGGEDGFKELWSRAQQKLSPERAKQIDSMWRAPQTTPDGKPVVNPDGTIAFSEDVSRLPDVVRILMSEVGLASSATVVSPTVGSVANSIATGGFSSKAEMEAAQDAILNAGGKWSKDPAFMSRLNATPAHILRG